MGSKQALSLSLALHELATNAAKYGSLSMPSGRVDISWDIISTDLERSLRFEWRETGGPAVIRPIVAGFGSRLMRRVLSADFGAEPELSFQQEGIVFRLVAPLSRVRDTSPTFF